MVLGWDGVVVGLGATRLGGVHGLLADVHLPEALEEGQHGGVQALPRPLAVALRMQARVHGLQQPEHARGQVAVQRLLGGAPARRISGCRTASAAPRAPPVQPPPQKAGEGRASSRLASDTSLRSRTCRPAQGVRIRAVQGAGHARKAPPGVCQAAAAQIGRAQRRKRAGAAAGRAGRASRGRARLAIGGGGGLPAAHDRADDVHQPRELPLQHGQVRIAGAAARAHLLRQGLGSE